MNIRRRFHYSKRNRRGLDGGVTRIASGKEGSLGVELSEEGRKRGKRAILGIEAQGCNRYGVASVAQYDSNRVRALAKLPPEQFSRAAKDFSGESGADERRRQRRTLRDDLAALPSRMPNIDPYKLGENSQEDLVGLKPGSLSQSRFSRILKAWKYTSRLSRKRS